MKKVDFEERTGKLNNDFFTDENSGETGDLIFKSDAQVLKPAENKVFFGRKNYFPEILKQVFFFLPGTLLLLFTGFVGTIIFTDIVIFQRPFATLPPSAPFQIIFILTLGIFGTFMTWFGFGNLKNRKHFAIPASIIAVSAIVAVFLRIAEMLFPSAGQLLEEFNRYFIYLLPFSLIAAVLAKSWADRSSKNNSLT